MQMNFFFPYCIIIPSVNSSSTNQEVGPLLHCPKAEVLFPRADITAAFVSSFIKIVSSMRLPMEVQLLRLAHLFWNGSKSFLR